MYLILFKCKFYSYCNFVFHDDFKELDMQILVDHHFMEGSDEPAVNIKNFFANIVTERRREIPRSPNAVWVPLTARFESGWLLQ